MWKIKSDTGNTESVYSTAARQTIEMGTDPDVDPAMYTTMPPDNMIDHPGGPIYDTPMLRLRSWNVMGNTSLSVNYWRTWVERSMAGIVNSTMSKHSIGRPYIQMRNAMILGTIVIPECGHDGEIDTR